MPLPKAPARPADTVERKSAVLAKRASATRKSRQPTPRQATKPALEPHHSVASGQPATPGAQGQSATARGAESPARTSRARLLQVETRGNGPGTPKSAPDLTPETAREQPPGTIAGATRAKAPDITPHVVPNTTPDVPTGQQPAPQSNGKSADRTARGTGAGRRRHKSSAGARLFVLDTNVLMHDPSCLHRFAEHDVFLPLITLEELDNHKRGTSEVSRNVRQISRALDELLAENANGIDAGLPLSINGSKAGRLYFQTESLEYKLPDALPAEKADNNILSVVAALKEKRTDREVVLVSKDINMRIKASMLGLVSEDYFNDQVIEDADLLESGVVRLPEDFWEHSKDIESWADGGDTFYRLSGPLTTQLGLNQFVYFEGEMPLSAKVIESTERHVTLRTTRDCSNLKNSMWGITARNREQNFAMNLLSDPDVDFVTLLGQAGTGKTLLALAAGLMQVMDHKRYTEIIMTRATVPVGDDIGYLPGTEEEKMQPWMGALEDNLEVLGESDPAGGDWGRCASEDLLRSRIKIKSLSFMRGRTFINKFLIIDEAQNLTPKQMKTLITRAGPGTKIICLGNIAQIDTPYLTEASSGLTYVVDRMRGWAHAGHITLERGERSRLADFASDAL